MKGSRLHLDMFRVFCDLAETKSFGRAAAKNYLTQSAVSQQLGFLERRLGKKLVERGRRRFSLTEEGKAFLEGCSRIVRVYQETEDRIRHPGEVSGMVRVETVYSIGLFSLAGYVKTFMKRYPQVNLHVEFERSNRIYEDVADGNCDLGVVAYPQERPPLKTVPFQKERLAVICASDDPLAAGKSVGLKSLARRAFVAFDKDIPTRVAMDDILRKNGVFVDIVREFDNIETVKRSVEIGVGVSIVPENTIAQEVKNGTLKCLAIAGRALYRPTGILYKKDVALSRAALEFVGWLAKPPDRAST